METKLLMDVEEYLHTSFDNADCEYLDGEVVERNMGEWPHAMVQKILLFLLGPFESRFGLQVVPEIRIQIHSRRFRVADVAAWLPGDVGGAIPTVPPFLAIEILSSDDRMSRMRPKIAEYLSIGVAYVWLIDPRKREAFCYSAENPFGASCDVLTTGNPDIDIPLSALFIPGNRLS